MTRTLTSPANTQRLAASKDVRWVIEIDWDLDGSWSGKYSDQSFMIGGDSYDDFVLEFEPLNQSLDVVSIGAVDSFRVIFKTDDTENFFVIFLAAHGEGRPVRIGVHYLTTGTADVIYMFDGSINEVGRVSHEGMVVDILSFGAKAHRVLPLRVINEGDFPDSLLEDRGKRIPIVYGELDHCPGIAISGEQPTTLFSSITEDADTIPIESLERFQYGLTAKIDNEEILYLGVTRSYAVDGGLVAALTDCTRGINGTDPAPHESGAVVSRLVSSIYIFADHACETMWIPRVDSRKALPYTIRRASSTIYAREGERTCYVIFLSSPPLYLDYANGVVELHLIPNETAGNNAATNPENARSVIEAASFATITAGSSPLSLNHTVDVSGFDESRGLIKAARHCIRYTTTEDFDVGMIEYDTVRI